MGGATEDGGNAGDCGPVGDPDVVCQGEAEKMALCTSRIPERSRGGR
jgi:hypothetical protein